MLTTKVAIRARVEELDQQLQRRKATLPQQQDERLQLMQSCGTHGGHVPSEVYGFLPGVGMHVDYSVCEFCGLQMGPSREQLARNLTRA